MINQAAHVRTAGGDVFVKWNTNAPAGFFAVEASGLNILRSTRTLRVPNVIGCSEANEDGIAVLILEYIAARQPRDRTAFARRFGEELAQMHHSSAPADGLFGLDRDNFIGSLVQQNRLTERWPEFYRDQRLLPQIRIAKQLGRLSAERERGLLNLLLNLEEILDGLASRPALLHGDLWSGNYLASGEEPVLIDPAVYYGEREMEIAYIELFGGFPPGFLEAYRSTLPQEPGYERRRPLHQLYPLLVHLNHFGEGYGADVDAIWRSYLR